MFHNGVGFQFHRRRGLSKEFGGAGYNGKDLSLHSYIELTRRCIVHTRRPN